MKHHYLVKTRLNQSAWVAHLSPLNLVIQTSITILASLEKVQPMTIPV